MTSAVYRVEGLRAGMGAPAGYRDVLCDISFAVEPGEILAIVGRSGVGKTTLLRVLGGLHGNYDGTVLFNDEAVRRPPRGAVMVFQDFENALLPWRNVARNVALGVEDRMPRNLLHDRVSQTLAMVGLADRKAAFPRQLSGGMAQRVQLARALAVRPQVLLMDEPFGALDAITKSMLQDVVLDAHRELGTTIVFVTHDLDEAIYLSDRVMVLAGSPAGVTATVHPGLPRPRDQLSTRELPSYLAARQALAAALRARE